MTDQVAGKVAFVTGGAMGIGRGVAEELAAGGCRVALCDVNDSVTKVADSLAASGGEVLAVQADVRDPDAVARGLEQTAGRFGGVDVLVGCAGVARYGDVEELSVDDWDLQLDTNLRSIFLLAKYGIPHLRARGGGVIISIASVQAFGTQRGVPAYTASKGGIVALTRSLAVDHAHQGIRAVAIAPGSVDTPMLHTSAALSADEHTTEAEILENWGRSHPIGRLATVEDVARLVSFLASDAAAMITGTTVTIDGGLSAQLGVVR